MPLSSSRPSVVSSPARGLGLARGLLPVHTFLVGRSLQRRRLEVALAAGALSPPAGEHGVVDLAFIAAPNEDRLAGRPHLLALADIDQRERPRIVDRGSEVDVQPGRAQRPTEAHRLVEQPSPIDFRPPGVEIITPFSIA